jgi:hypothetical protein
MFLFWEIFWDQKKNGDLAFFGVHFVSVGPAGDVEHASVVENAR